MSLTFIPELTEMVGVSRAVSVKFPYGAAMGNPGNRGLQMATLDYTLKRLSLSDPAGTISSLPFNWKQVP